MQITNINMNMTQTSAVAKTNYDTGTDDFKFNEIFEKTTSEMLVHSEGLITEKAQLTTNLSFEPVRTIEKPNLRQLAEKIYGEDLDAIYLRSPAEYKKVCLATSELLYVVAGAKDDTRNWAKIMSSENPVSDVRKETFLMHGPQIDVEKIKSMDGSSMDIAMIKTKDGQKLRVLHGDKERDIRQVLMNYGFTSETISPIQKNKIQSADLHKTIKNAVQYFEDINKS